MYNTDADKPSEEPEAPADDADKPEPFEPKIDCGGSGIVSRPVYAWSLNSAHLTFKVLWSSAQGDALR